jgi:hypothetical protein
MRQQKEPRRNFDAVPVTGEFQFQSVFRRKPAPG